MTNSAEKVSATILLLCAVGLAYEDGQIVKEFIANGIDLELLIIGILCLAGEYGSLLVAGALVNQNNE